MKISARELGYLLAECFNAISPETAAADAARWRRRVGELMGKALRRDPDDVLWALEGCEVVPLPDDVEAVASGQGAPSEADIVWAAIEHDRVAQLSGDYTIPSNEVPGDIALDFIWRMEPSNEPGPNEYDMPDDSEPIVVPEGKAPPLPDSPAPKEPAPQKTEGFLCKVPGLDRASLKEIRRRASWVRSAVHDSEESGGRMDLVSIFPDGTPNSSYSGYEDLVKPYRKMGGCFEEVIWIERKQDDIPLLQSLPDGIVIDFPGIRPGGTKGEYGILRMARGKDGRWKVGFVWIMVTDAHRRTDIFTDKIRLAVFAAKPQTEKHKK